MPKLKIYSIEPMTDGSGKMAVDAEAYYDGGPVPGKHKTLIVDAGLLERGTADLDPVDKQVDGEAEILRLILEAAEAQEMGKKSIDDAVMEHQARAATNEQTATSYSAVMKFIKLPAEVELK